jgi:hypothetical protein
MDTTATHRPAPEHTQRWTTSRVFRTALAITLAVLTALIVTFALSYLVFGTTSRVVLESEGVIDEVTTPASGDTVTQTSAP